MNPLDDRWWQVFCAALPGFNAYEFSEPTGETFSCGVADAVRLAAAQATLATGHTPAEYKGPKDE